MNSDATDLKLFGRAQMAGNMSRNPSYESQQPPSIQAREDRRHHYSSNRSGGRYGVENPRRNLITFKVTEDEEKALDIMSKEFGSRSEMIRTVLFDFAEKEDME